MSLNISKNKKIKLSVIILKRSLFKDLRHITHEPLTAKVSLDTEVIVLWKNREKCLLFISAKSLKIILLRGLKRQYQTIISETSKPCLD